MLVHALCEGAKKRMDSQAASQEVNQHCLQHCPLCSLSELMNRYLYTLELTEARNCLFHPLQFGLLATNQGRLGPCSSQTF